MYACIYVPLNIRVKMPNCLDAVISQNESREMIMIALCCDYDGIFPVRSTTRTTTGGPDSPGDKRR